MVRVSPGSPSQWNATLSPRPAATWRSRQFSETLSLPPTNHFANGSCQSRIVCHGCDHCTSSAAWRAQKPSSSRAASSYRKVPTTSASALNDSDGGNVRFSAIRASMVSCCSLIAILPSGCARLVRDPRQHVRGSFARDAQPARYSSTVNAPSPLGSSSASASPTAAAHPHRRQVGRVQRAAPSSACPRRPGRGFRAAGATATGCGSCRARGNWSIATSLVMSWRAGRRPGSGRRARARGTSAATPATAAPASAAVVGDCSRSRATSRVRRRARASSSHARAES